MKTEERRRIINTSEFYYLLSGTDREMLLDLIGADLSQIKFKESTHLSNLNLSHTILDGVDLYQSEITRCNLSSASLKMIELYRANLIEVNFTNTDFTQANLRRACSKRCTFKNTNFANANLEEMDFDGVGNFSSQRTIIEGSNFEKAILKKANLRGYNPKTPKSHLDLSTCNLENTNLNGALYDLNTRFPKGINLQTQGAYCITSGVSLKNADLSFTNLFRANLSGANLSGANLTGARIHSANFNGADLTEATIVYEKGRWDRDLYANLHMEQAILRKATIIGINPDNTCMYFNGVDLTEAKLINCAFTYMEMNGAKLVNLRLDGCDFSNAQLRGADFSNTSLRGCNFSSTDLRGANFNNSDLSGANLSCSQLTNTDLSQAKLDGVNFRNASLDGIKLN